MHLRQSQQDRGSLDDALRSIHMAQARVGAVTVEPVWIEGGYDPEAARPVIEAALARGPWDVVFTGNMGFASIVRKLDREVSLVYEGAADPRALCLADNLTRPGNRASGYTAALPAEAKMTEALLDLYPQLRQVTVLIDGTEGERGPCLEPVQTPVADPVGCVFGVVPPAIAARQVEAEAVVALARQRGVAVEFVSTCDMGDIDRLHLSGAVAPATERGFVVPFRLLFFESSRQLVERVNASGSPAIYGRHSFARNGGLMSLSPTLERRGESRAAEVLLRVLEGEPAGEVPVQLPHGFELMFNVRTAEATGHTPDPAALVQVRRFLQ